MMGGAVPDDIGVRWLPYTETGRSYDVDMQDFYVGDKSVGAPAFSYRGTIVDSGTTFTYLPPTAYFAARDHFRTHCPWGACATRFAKGEYPDDYCYSMKYEELAGFTPYRIGFAGGVREALRPSHPLAEFTWSPLARTSPNAHHDLLSLVYSRRALHYRW